MGLERERGSFRAFFSSLKRLEGLEGGGELYKIFSVVSIG